MVCFKYPLTTFVILAATTTLSVDAKRDYSIELLQITTKVSDEQFFKFVNHSIPNVKMANFDLLMDKKAKEWSMKLNVDALTNGKRRINILKTELNVCEILKSSSQNKIVAIILKEIFRTSNVPRKCPFTEQVIYSVKNFTINDESFPPILPAATWQLDMNSIVNKVYSFNISIKGRIRKFE